MENGYRHGIMVVVCYGFVSPSTVLIYIKGLRDTFIMVIMVLWLSVWYGLVFPSTAFQLNHVGYWLNYLYLKFNMTAIYILVQYQDKA